MKTLLAGFLALGMIVSTGIAFAGSAHAANAYVGDRVTVSGDNAG
ncbi:MAG TPA: hypothetical protein VFA03_09480 [Acetobacteraceae bacterium]|nr:hypothetical protein [Acetobacteraceae bacterium]